MRSFRSDPYLWVHLAGVAAVPLFLEICLLGLGVGHPLMPLWFELLFVAGLGIAPIVWMQWQKPFSIFSLLLLALRPNQLSEDQRKILRLFKTPINQFLAIGVAIVLALVLWLLYHVAPVTTGLVLPNAARGVGLLWAAIAFLFANLFLQVPVSVLRVLLTGDQAFGAIEPYPVEQITADFTLLGLRVKKILPVLEAAPSKPVVIRPESPPQETPAAILSETLPDAEPTQAVSAQENVIATEPEEFDEDFEADFEVESRGDVEAVAADAAAEMGQEDGEALVHNHGEEAIAPPEAPVEPEPDAFDAAMERQAIADFLSEEPDLAMEDESIDDLLGQLESETAEPQPESNWEEAIETELMMGSGLDETTPDELNWDEPSLEATIETEGNGELNYDRSANEIDTDETERFEEAVHGIELEVIALGAELPATDADEIERTDGTDDVNELDEDTWGDEEDLHA
jgi:hypothetical protein